MQQRGRVPIKKESRSFRTAIVLTGILVVVFLLVRGFERSGLPSTLSTLIHADFENFRHLEQFDDEKSDEARKRLSGLWTYSEGDPETSTVAKKEYMELMDNGMIWKVVVWDINDPMGEHHTITNVITGFFRPYSYSSDGDMFFNETRIIRQALIADGDTCYGASHVDEIWQIARTGDNTLTANRREYQLYTGVPAEFFPDGDMLDIVNMITVRRCPVVFDVPWLAKRVVERTMTAENAIPFFLMAQTIDTLIKAYHKPIILDELARRFDPRAVPDEMPVRMTISPEGAVTDLRYRRANIVTRRFDDLAVPEMRTWRFPVVNDVSGPQRLELVVRVK
ncbi:MAG: hypothetical protein LBU70_08605 [Chitinispirillales bacterium]|jgi:hypothetical protein|nr:hypothetical protein [Chitinispirillales bacterium]